MAAFTAVAVSGGSAIRVTASRSTNLPNPKTENAIRLLKTRHGEIVTGKFAGLTAGCVSVAELLELVLQDYINNDRRSLDDLKTRIRTQVQPYFGELRAADLTTGAGHSRRRSETRRSDEQAEVENHYKNHYSAGLGPEC
jgi:hypothetical protein